MKQLTDWTEAFYMETATTFGHVSGLGLYERPDDDFDLYDEVYARWGSFVGELEPMRRRVVEVLLRLDHPYWVMDPNFDLEFHIRHLSLAPPGAGGSAGRADLEDHRAPDGPQPAAVGGLCHRGPGEWALGAADEVPPRHDRRRRAMMLKLMHDTSPDATSGREPAMGAGGTPSQAELLRLTFQNFLRNPAKAARTQLRLVREYAEAAGLESVGAVAGRAGSAIRSMVAPGDGPQVNLPMSAAPPTPWNRLVTAHRRFAMRSASLDNIKRLKDATGGTVNDVVMAICAGALRAYLTEHNALTDRPLRAMVPVSIRTRRRTDEPGVRSRCRPANPPRRSARTGGPVPEAMLEMQQFELVPARR